MRIRDFILRGTAANRPAANSVSVGALYYSTDTAVTEFSDGTNWQTFSDGGSGGITELTGDVTAGPGVGSEVATIANNAVTTSKIIDDAVTFAKLLNATQICVIGADAAGNFKEVTIGANLTLAAGVLSASGGAASDWTTTITKAADDSVGNTTITDDSELQLPTLAANSVWYIEALILYSANNATNDYKFDFAVTAGTIFGAMHVTHMNTSNSPVDSVIGANAAASISPATVVGPDASDTVFGFKVQGVLQFSNSTNFKYRFALNSGAGTTVKTRIGSILRGKRLQ